MSLATFMQWVSALSSLWAYFVVVPLVAGALILNRHRRLALATVLVTAGNVLNPLIKNIAQRPRPTNAFDGYSFPSGHALGAMVFYGFLACLAWRSGSRPLAVLLSLFIVLVGLSRVYVGAHYVSDIIGGYLIGVFWLFSFLRMPVVKRLIN